MESKSFHSVWGGFPRAETVPKMMPRTNRIRPKRTPLPTLAPELGWDPESLVTWREGRGSREWILTDIQEKPSLLQAPEVLRGTQSETHCVGRNSNSGSAET